MRKDETEEPTLGQVVKAGREQAGLSIRECAKLVGLHYSNLSRLEAGEHDRPTAETLQRLADVLELDAATLLAFIGVKPALPEPKIYFRRAYGMSETEAAEAAAIIENLRAHHKEQQRGDENADTD